MKCNRSAGSVIFTWPAVLFVLFLSGCSGLPLQTDALLQNPPAVNRAVEITSTPFNPQKAYQCGPAALATLLQHNGLSIKADALVAEVYLPEKRGSLQTELISTSRKYSLIPNIIEPSMTGLLQELDAGNPVLVLQNLGLSFAPQWHYAIVIGYDIDTKNIILRSGEFKRHINSFSLFERTWQRAKYWGLVITPATKLAITSTPLQVLKTGFAFEQTGKANLALNLYKTAINKWPEDVSLLLAAGNNAFNQSEYKKAEQYYQTVLEHQPNSATAIHNLANVYIEYKFYQQAEELLHKAIKLGGRFVDNYKQTLATVQKLQISKQ